jgi:hypothetical protein
MARGRPITQTVEERFNKKYKINETTDCWEWQYATNNLGYGFFRNNDKMRLAHRVSYEINNGPIPSGMCVCHLCDNPVCVNPDHLWLGTVKENMHDMIKKGRANKRTKEDGFRLPRTSCEHCNQVDIPINIYARNHGDKCKHKP